MPFKSGKGPQNAAMKIKRISDGLTSNAEPAIYEVLTVIAGYATIETPVDTSTLINSQYKRVKATSIGAVGLVGYTANYAMPVHDPNVKMKFKKPGAKKEFLTRQYSENKAELDKLFERRIKR